MNLGGYKGFLADGVTVFFRGESLSHGYEVLANRYVFQHLTLHMRSIFFSVESNPFSTQGVIPPPPWHTFAMRETQAL